MFEKRLEAFLIDYGMNLKPTKRSWISDCLNPACGKEAHMYIQKKDGQSVCFKCGFKWHWTALVSVISRVSRKEAWEVIFGSGAGDRPLALDPDLFSSMMEEKEKIDVPIVIGPDFIPVTNCLAALEYLHKRGVGMQAIFDYDLRYNGSMNAVIFPIYRDGKSYGWQARKINPEPGELRMISYSFNKSRFLLNYDRAKTADKIVLVEGPFDCVHCDVSGFGSVASLGKGVSQDQIGLILNSSAKDVYIGLDPDAFIEMYEVVSCIGLNKRVHRMAPPKHREDFGECTHDEVVESMESAILISGKNYLEAYFS